MTTPITTTTQLDAPGDCWEWDGPRTSMGYGIQWQGARYKMAHRLSYEEHVGPIPDGLVLDHLCRNRGCINPAHLEPVTDAVNVLRGVGPTAVNAAKTECIAGHPFNDENTKIRSHGWRKCQECARQAERQRNRPPRLQKPCPRCGKVMNSGNLSTHVRTIHPLADEEAGK